MRGSAFQGFETNPPAEVGQHGSRPSSGSHPQEGMVVVPCSMGTLGAIASGAGTNLIHRAADVTLKESRKLILVPRETPYNAIHLENMLRLARAGGPYHSGKPGFYHRPATIEALVDHLVFRILTTSAFRTTNDPLAR